MSYRSVIGSVRSDKEKRSKHSVCKAVQQGAVVYWRAQGNVYTRTGTIVCDDTSADCKSVYCVANTDSRQADSVKLIVNTDVRLY